MGCPFRNPTRRIIPIMKNDMTDRCLPSLSMFFCSGVFGVSYGENKNGFFFNFVMMKLGWLDITCD